MGLFLSPSRELAGSSLPTALLVLALLLGLAGGYAAAGDEAARDPFDPGGGVQIAADGKARFLYTPEFRSATWLKQQLGLHPLKAFHVDLVTPIVAVAPPRGSTKSKAPEAGRLLLHGAPESVAQARELLARLDLAERAVFVSLLLTEVVRGTRGSSGGSLLFDKAGGTNPENTLFRGSLLGFEPDDYIRSSVTGAMPFEGTSLGFGHMDASGGAFEYTLRMLQRRGEAEFLAWPSLLCTEGEPAEMMATELLPNLVTTSLSRNVAGAARITTARRESVVRVETGLKLRVTPVRIGRESAVLDIDVWLTLPQEMHDGTTTPGALRLRKREVTTRLTVRDQEPLCFGGIILRNRGSSRRGLPRDKALSVLDPIHSAMLKEKGETEIVFLIRARIVQPRVRPPELDPRRYRRWTEVGPRAGAVGMPGPWSQAKHPARK